MKMNNFIFAQKEERPWGVFYVLHDEAEYKLKRIEVNPRSRLSYQYHNKRAETWVIVFGEAKVTLDDHKHILKKGDTIIIPRLSKHRIENLLDSTLIFIEIQTGEYFGEDDIVRISDDYSRDK